MGFLKNLKEGFAAAQAAGLAMSGAEQVQVIPAFISPRSQEEVDSLLAGSGTVRAIVIGKQHQVLERGERVGSMGVKIEVRLREAAGKLGQPVVLKARLSSLTTSLVVPGLDIPVERDPATGALTRVASAQLTDELSGRMDEAKKRNPGAAWDSDVEAIIDLVKLPFTERPTAEEPPAAPNDPRLAPVDGMTWQTYVAIHADLQLNGAPNGEDAVAQRHGALPYTWLALSTVWKNRIAADPELAELFARELAAATAG